MNKYYFVTYFLSIVLQYVRWKLKEKVDTLIHFCFSSRVRVYTKKLVKVATFFIYMFTPLIYSDLVGGADMVPAGLLQDVPHLPAPTRVVHAKGHEPSPFKTLNINKTFKLRHACSGPMAFFLILEYCTQIG